MKPIFGILAVFLTVNSVEANLEHHTHDFCEDESINVNVCPPHPHENLEPDMEILEEPEQVQLQQLEEEYVNEPAIDYSVEANEPDLVPVAAGEPESEFNAAVAAADYLDSAIPAGVDAAYEGEDQEMEEVQVGKTKNKKFKRPKSYFGNGYLQSQGFGSMRLGLNRPRHPPPMQFPLIGRLYNGHGPSYKMGQRRRQNVLAWKPMKMRPAARRMGRPILQPRRTLNHHFKPPPHPNPHPHLPRRILHPNQRARNRNASFQDPRARHFG